MAPSAVPVRTPGMFSALAPAASTLFASANACAPGAAIDLATAAIGQAGRGPMRPPPVDVSAAINEVNAPHVQSQHFELPNGLAPPGPMRILICWLKVPTRCSPRWTPRWERLDNTMGTNDAQERMHFQSLNTNVRARNLDPQSRYEIQEISRDRQGSSIAESSTGNFQIQERIPVGPQF